MKEQKIVKNEGTKERLREGRPVPKEIGGAKGRRKKLKKGGHSYVKEGGEK